MHTARGPKHNRHFVGLPGVGGRVSYTEAGEVLKETLQVVSVPGAGGSLACLLPKGDQGLLLRL